MRLDIDRIVPSFALHYLRQAKRSAEFGLLVWLDARRFLRYHARDVGTADLRGLQAHLIFHAHSIEKGLSHSKLRYGFGESAVGSLIATMGLYASNGWSKEAHAYQMALSVLREYSYCHEKEGIWDTPLSSAPEWLLGEVRSCSSGMGGVYEKTRTELPISDVEGFRAVVFGRQSVREYDSRSVSAAKVSEAVRVASRAPSVCNRQSIRVRVIERLDLIERILKIQGGFGGYPSPPALLIVTADARDYVAATERNQPYVDGGLFSMALLLGLESVDLAACALNAMFSLDQDREMRDALDLPSSDLVIMLIAIGEFPSSYRVPKSFRYDPSDLIVSMEG